jgi:O-antigen/teichoic acid export membrane protein
MLLARFLGIEDFGRFTLVWMVAMFVNSLQDAAIIQPMLAVGPKQAKAEAPAYYGTVLVQQLLSGTIAFSLVLIIAQASAAAIPGWAIDGLAVPLAAALLATQLQNFVRRYLFVRGWTITAIINDGIRYLGQLSMLYVAAIGFATGPTVPMALWITAIAAILGTLHGVLYLEKPIWSTQMLRRTTVRHWHIAKWLLPSDLMQWAAAQVFFVTAGIILGASAVGLLRAAQAIVGVVHIIYMGMTNFAPRHASQVLHQQGIEALFHYLKGLTWKIGSILLLLLVLINVNAKNFSRLMYGTGYPDLRYLLLGLSAVYFVPLVSDILGVWALAIESTEVVFISRAVTTAFAAVAAYPLVAFGRLLGVLAGFLLVELIRAGIMLTVLRRKAPAQVLKRA